MDVNIKRNVQTLGSSGSNTNRNREAPVGILRLDAGKPRRSSTEFKFNVKVCVQFHF